MQNATHYIEQFRQEDKTKLVNGPVQPIGNIRQSLNLTKKSNCKTIAIWKIKFKPGFPIINNEQLQPL